MHNAFLLSKNVPVFRLILYKKKNCKEHRENNDIATKKICKDYL